MGLKGMRGQTGVTLHIISIRAHRGQNSAHRDSVERKQVVHPPTRIVYINRGGWSGAGIDHSIVQCACGKIQV